MSYRGNKMLKQGLLILPLVALLTGCGLEVKDDKGTGSAQTQTVSEPSVQVVGAAMKGVIRQGIVTANRLVADQSGRYRLDKLAANAVRTADDGSYKLRLPGTAEGWALVELRADQNTRMVCDVVPSCDQAGAEPVMFGDTLSLDSDFVLLGAGNLAVETVHLTPLTHLAVTLAQRNADGELSPTALTNAYVTVEKWFGLTAGALAMSPPDLSRLDELNEVSADGLQVAIANAAFLALVNDNPQWQSIADVLNDMTAQITASGQIDILGDGSSLALADVVSAATLQADELQKTTNSSIVSQKLAITASRNVHRFKSIADVYDESDTSLADKDSGADEAGNGSSPTGGGSTPSDSVADNSAGKGAVDSEAPAPGHSEGGAGNTGADTAGNGNSLPGGDVGSEAGALENAALLSWTAPMTRVNGESLSMGEIAGFEVVYGTNAEALDQSLAIGDASVDELLVDQLGAGNWYFAIRTLDTDGNRSQLSEVVNKQI